jgi:CBS domain containing-hemolysin-like protein
MLTDVTYFSPEDVVTLSTSALLSPELVDTLFLSGYSRFPVHYRNDPGACVGLLLLKRCVVLIFFDIRRVGFYHRYTMGS